MVSGTSAACAHVSGALGLILARFPLAPGLPAARHLLAHTEKVPSLSGLVRTGRLDAYAPLLAQPSAVDAGGDHLTGAHAGLRLWAQSVLAGEVRLGLYLPADDTVRLTVFDVRGRRIRQLHAGRLPAGIHEINWDTRTDVGERAASGVYLVRLAGRTEAVTKRLGIRR